MSQPNTLNLSETCVTAVFLWNGFWEVLVQEKQRNEETLYYRHIDGLGQEGLAVQLAEFARAIEERCAARWAPAVADRGFPGVYQYEVIEELGRQLATADKSVGYRSITGVVALYDELMAAWLVEDKLTVSRPFNPITSP